MRPAPFSVIFGTLVVQGLTLVPLRRRLGLHDDGADEVEEAHARRAAIEAALGRLDEEVRRGAGDTPVVAALRTAYGARLSRWRAHDQQTEGARDAERDAARYRTLRAAMIAAERDTVITLRDRGTIGDDVLRRVQRDLDLETMLLQSAEADAPDSPYDVE